MSALSVHECCDTSSWTCCCFSSLLFRLVPSHPIACTAVYYNVICT